MARQQRMTLLTRKDADLGVGNFDSIAWVFEVHVKELDNSEFNSAVLYGDENAPEAIDFFREVEPLITSHVARHWVPETKSEAR